MNDTPANSSLINQVEPTATDPGGEPAPAVDQVQNPPPPAETEPAGEGAPDAASVEPPAPLSAEDLTLPEGAEPDEEGLAAYLEFANEQGLSKEQAQGALDLYSSQVKTLAEQMHAQWEATQNEWQEAVKALPEIGGDKLDSTLAEVAKVVDRYGSKDLRTALDVTGAGNNPHVVQFLHNIAKAVNEQPPVSGQPTTTSPKSLAERLYGTGT
jgi:hypothetical protein